MKSVFENDFFSTNRTLHCGGRLIDLQTPRVMGILNVTPDSFFEGSRYSSLDQVQAQAGVMLEAGATFLDIGGYSTRPGAADITVAEEVERVVPAIRAILTAFPGALISVDTFRSEVAAEAVAAGAHLINDVSGGTLDPAMFDTVARLQIPYVLMHMRGTPQTMATQTNYTDLLKEVLDFLHPALHALRQRGVKDVIIDPGFGFAKTPAQNFELLQHFEHFRVLGCPMLAGLSRKSMIWRTLEQRPEDALNGTTVLNTIALVKGAGILRVHDVREAVEAVKLVMLTTRSSAQKSVV
ncbi:dihydropteroate synthase [Parachryseolinea silvisoli]|jgi:dihydropteroate synthase|uniref:dihydropteroate synthase n=1 Tax=Parachryseolinea silvisoli TaxID=2873601 RepID=UPI002265E22A|nr:dihydropteroate synthase [Parachryseolinea silvisoli]MCD9019561.1 dihydropteroate synthase [Parachryseolinea silvisoli]